MGLVTIDTAVKKLKEGTPVALPTETVYGLGCPIDQPDALKKVFEIKKRPLNDPLIVHVSDLEMALTLLDNPSEDFTTLANVFWPGPLTLISKKNKDRVSDLITSNLDSVAIRLPDSPLFREVIKKVGAPLAAPSANMFKKVSPTSAKHVLKTLPQVDVLDGGSSDVGIESTIFDVDSLTILRPGMITHLDLEKVLNKRVNYKETSHTPGSETDHYQPNTPVFVFGKRTVLESFKKENNTAELVLSNDPKESASLFYAKLRELDGTADKIVIYYNDEWTIASWLGLKNRILKSSSKWT